MLLVREEKRDFTPFVEKFLSRSFIIENVRNILEVVMVKSKCIRKITFNSVFEHN